MSLRVWQEVLCCQQACVALLLADMTKVAEAPVFVADVVAAVAAAVVAAADWYCFAHSEGLHLEFGISDIVSKKVLS